MPDEVLRTALEALVLVSTGDAHSTGFFSATNVVTTAQRTIGIAKSATIKLRDGSDADATVMATAGQYGLVRLLVAANSRKWLPPSPTRDLRSAQGLARLSWVDTTARGGIKGLLREHGLALFQTDLLLHTEDEGSPIVDRTGRVVAVVSGGRTVSFDAAQAYFRAP